MQFTTFTVTSLLAALVAAVPAPIAEAAPAVNAVDAVAATQLIDVWQDKDFLGLKFTGSSTVGTCVNFPSNFNDILSSGKAKAGFRCTVWVDANCVGTGFSFNANPGSNLFPSWINDKASSWKCVNA